MLIHVPEPRLDCRFNPVREQYKRVGGAAPPLAPSPPSCQCSRTEKIRLESPPPLNHTGCFVPSEPPAGPHRPSLRGVKQVAGAGVWGLGPAHQCSIQGSP